MLTSENGWIANVNSICTNPSLSCCGLDGGVQPGIIHAAFNGVQKGATLWCTTEKCLITARLLVLLHPWSCPAERSGVHLCLLQTTSTYSSPSNPWSVSLPRGWLHGKQRLDIMTIWGRKLPPCVYLSKQMFFLFLLSLDFRLFVSYQWKCFCDCMPASYHRGACCCEVGRVGVGSDVADPPMPDSEQPSFLTS